MHAHLITIEHGYPENIQLIDEAFDRFDWDNYPKESLSIEDIDSFYDHAIDHKKSNGQAQNLSNPYADR